ncbi:MAG: ribosome biogenesis GTPase Der, partial [Saprospiraceae bacterium]|nr:ribosome biogenesis GTPase Der [Saprospiraceae bacterium]
KAIDEADVCILMIDAQTGMESQDMSIFHLAQKRNKGIVLLVNKWDLVEKDTNTARDYEIGLRNKISPFSDVPILFVSALEKQRIFKTVEVALEVYENRQKKIKTSVLNEVMLAVIERNPPPSHRGRFIKIKFVTQLPTYYPAFVFFCNNPKYVKDNYQNYLENQLRKNFDFTGVPISVFFRNK